MATPFTPSNPPSRPTSAAGAKAAWPPPSANGLQLPTKQGPAGSLLQNAAVAAAAAGGMSTPIRPGPGSSAPVTRQPSVDAQDSSGNAGQGGSDSRATNVDELMDAVGASGVDIGAEEEGLRAANERLQAQAPQHPSQDRSRKQDFIEPGVLAECVKKIAAGFSLRTLEPDTIPLIALATRHRLSSLINDAIAARDHRRNSTHLRPPPFTLPSNKRRREGDDDEDAEEEDDDDDDEDEEFDEFDFVTGEVKPKKQKPPKLPKPDKNTPVAAWDAVIFDESEKLLGVLERVDREEERKKRRERMLRDQREQEERDLAEAVAASEQAARDAEAGGSSGAGLVTGTPKAGGGAPGTPKGDGAETPLGKDGKPKKKKKPKADGTGATPGGAGAAAGTSTPGTNPRNLSEDVKKRLTDQVAMRSLGGKNFSWLNASGAGAGGIGSPTPSNLPKPKFAPASSLPPPTFAAPAASSSSTVNVPSGLSRLSNVPPLHDANRKRVEEEEWNRGKKVVELSDLLWAMDRERGAGVGKGSGRSSVLRARAGIVRK